MRFQGQGFRVHVFPEAETPNLNPKPDRAASESGMALKDQGAICLCIPQGLAELLPRNLRVHVLEAGVDFWGLGLGLEGRVLAFQDLRITFGV